MLLRTFRRGGRGIFGRQVEVHGLAVGGQCRQAVHRVAKKRAFSTQVGDGADSELGWSSRQSQHAGGREHFTSARLLDRFEVALPFGFRTLQPFFGFVFFSEESLRSQFQKNLLGGGDKFRL